MVEKQINSLKQKLKKAEQNIFFEKMRIDQECEEKIEKLIKDSEMSAKVNREFIIKVRRERQ